MKYDYYLQDTKSNLKRFNSKVEALEFGKENANQVAMIRRVKKEDTVIIPSLKKFYKAGIPFKTPTISPDIISARVKLVKVEKKDNHKGVKVIKIKK